MTEAQPDQNAPKTDAQLADEIRFALAPHMHMVCTIMDNAKTKGLRVNWQITTNQDGKSVVTFIDIVRPL